MKKLWGLLSAVCFVLIFSGVSHAARYSFTPLDYPDAVETYAQGISGSNIVGYYYKVNESAHGFLYDGDTWTQLDVTGANATYALGISGSNIVGYYYINGGHNHGFLCDVSDPENPSCTTLDADVLGAVETYAQGISGSDIVGNYMDGDGNWHGFLYDSLNDVWTTLDLQDEAETEPHGIDGSNIVGNYMDGDGNWHGFLYDSLNDVLTTFDLQDEAETDPRGIDGSNIVGSYIGGDGNWHGFLCDVSNPTTPSCTPLDAPNSYNDTYANGISGSNIVGRYMAPWSHGFLAQPAPELEVSPSFYDFDNVVINACSGWQEFTLSNPSTLQLVVSDITLSDTTNYELDLGDGSSNTCGDDPTIEAGQSCTIKLRFCPVTANDSGAFLTVTSNDPIDASIEIQGTGTCSYSISSDTASVKSNGGHVTIKVTATGDDYCPTPEVANINYWITSSRTRWKNNRGAVVFVVDKNTLTSLRTGGVEIEGNDVTIEQAGARK